jgi:hypothetical protein
MLCTFNKFQILQLMKNPDKIKEIELAKFFALQIVSVSYRYFMVSVNYEIMAMNPNAAYKNGCTILKIPLPLANQL